MKTRAQGRKFRVLAGRYAVCRLGATDPVPEWAEGAFCSITRTPDELAIICAAARVPADVRAERDWRVIKLVGPFPFTAVGVLASVATPLARAGISLLAIATYDTDYFLVRDEIFARALAVLRAAGHVKVR